MKSSFLALALAAAGHFMTAAAVTKIMPFGDSITEWGCWRAKLWTQLQQAGYRDIDFVGSMASTSESCGGVQYDKDNEGHAGFQAVNIASQNQLVGWLRTTGPVDIILMHLGTNDLFYNRSINDIIRAFGTLVDQMRANNPRIKIIVAKIIPASITSTTTQLNNAIDQWAPTKSTADSPITVVDQWTGFNANSDNKDGIHPNDSGDTKIANKWFPAVKAALDSLAGSPGATGGTPTATSTPTTTSSSNGYPTFTTTPPPAGTVNPWGQCGGNGYNGPTVCTSGYTCRRTNDWYSQCVPA